MKKLYRAAGILLSALLLFSCATTKKADSKNPADAADIDEELPFVSKLCTDNEIINTYHGGKIIKAYDELPPSFKDTIVFECQSEYYYNNKTETSVYELIYIGVKAFDGINIAESLEKNTPFANSTAEELKLICRSKNLDRYLISISNVIPKKYDGYYYYMPGIHFELYFQPGFKKYLEDECKPGDQIYFYVYVDSCNFFSKTYTAFVRDFSIASPEEIIDERIQMVKERME